MDKIEVFKHSASVDSRQDNNSLRQVNKFGLLNLPNILSTDEAAKALKVLPNTIRSAHSKTGSYMGLKPMKLPNRRLAWDAEAVASLLSTGSVN